MHQTWVIALLAAVGFWAGVQNALAGGGTFVTFPVLLLAGLDPRAANITSAVALFPGQIATGIAGRALVTGTAGLSALALSAISLVGGGLGAILLLATPQSIFTALVPWLVLFATVVFAWGSFRGPPRIGRELGRLPGGIAQFLIAIYGGYFGGGIGILMIAALTMAGLDTRRAGATKNALAAVINVAAVLIFVFSPDLNWLYAIFLGIGSIGGGQVGAWMLKRVNENWLRIAVIALGCALTVGLFWRG